MVDHIGGLLALTRQMNVAGDTFAVRLLSHPNHFITDRGNLYSLYRGRPRRLRGSMLGKYRGAIVDGQHLYIHRLVAEAFRGPAPGMGSKFNARHMDGDRFNNDASNVEWGTARENHLDKRRHGTSPEGERNPNARLWPSLVREIRKARGAGLSYRAVAHLFPEVTVATIGRLLRGESWRDAT